MRALVWRGAILGVFSMSSLHGRIVAYASLLALSKELDQLRERVKKAERLDAAKPSKQRTASFHRRAPIRRIH
jgi:hypothetical protein